MLAGLGLEAAPVVDAESLRRGLGQLGRSVGRVVVGQHDADGARIVGRSDVLNRLLDRRLLVERGDDDGDRGPLALAPRPRGRVELRRPIAREQQREAQEADHDRRDVREHDRDQPRHHRPDRFLHLRAPGLRDPHRERDPSDGCRRGERESQRRPQPERWSGPGGEPAEPLSLRSNRAHTPSVPWLAVASVRGDRPPDARGLSRRRCLGRIVLVVTVVDVLELGEHGRLGLLAHVHESDTELARHLDQDPDAELRYPPALGPASTAGSTPWRPRSRRPCDRWPCWSGWTAPRTSRGARWPARSCRHLRPC